MIRFTIPVKTRNPLNGSQGRTRGAVFATAARRKKERQAAALCMLAEYRKQREGSNLLFWLEPTVTMTRLSAGKLDGDGLQAALKSVRDGLADALGIDDGSNKAKWKYEQKKVKRGVYGVEVEIT